MNDLIERLALQKDFNELDAAERATVLREMPAESYEQIRNILLHVRDLDTGPPPPDALREHLFARMAASARPQGLQRVLVWRMPVWQAAAAVGIALLTGWFFRAPAPREITRPAVCLKTDTVIQEKIVRVDRFVTRESPRNFKPGKNEIRQPIPIRPDALPVAIAIPEAQQDSAQLGTSLGNEPALLDFFVQVR